MEQIIIKSGSLVTSKSINGEINSPRLIINIVEDNKMLIKVVGNIKFVYCSMLTNTLDDMLAERAYSSCT